MPYTTTDQHASGKSAQRIEARPLRGLKEIGVYVGRSEKTVLKLIVSDGLPAVKIGGGWESDEGAVDSWLARRMTE